MSHFTSIKTRIVDKRALLDALRDLGYTPEEGPVKIRGFEGIQTTADICVKTKNPDYDIGFRKHGDIYEIVADWFGLRDLDQKKWIDRLTQRYAYHAARAQLEEQGFTLASETEKDGRIHLVLRRMA